MYWDASIESQIFLGSVACVPNFVQPLLVGGLFPQFRLDSKQKYVIDEAGVRRMAGALLAIDRVNNKTDGVYDNLLPNTQVCCGWMVLA